MGYVVCTISTSECFLLQNVHAISHGGRQETMSCDNNYLTEWVSSDPILKSFSMSLSPFCRISVRRTCWNKAILISATEGALSLVTNSKISVTILCAVLREITEEDSLGVVGGGGGCTAAAVTGGGGGRASGGSSFSSSSGTASSWLLPKLLVSSSS